jgi:hypothetical protein
MSRNKRLGNTSLQDFPALPTRNYLFHYINQIIFLALLNVNGLMQRPALSLVRIS